jgi:hypothetical protein
MFDTYSQLRDDARTVAFLHPERLQNWPDAVRSNRNDDIEVSLHKAYSGGLFLFAARLTPYSLHRPTKRVRVHRHSAPLIHQPAVHRLPPSSSHQRRIQNG